MNRNKESLWLPEYSRLPTATWHDDYRVTLHDIRNFQFALHGGVTPGWYDRTFSLHDVKSVDMILSYWGSRHIAHVFLSFALAQGAESGLFG